MMRLVYAAPILPLLASLAWAQEPPGTEHAPPRPTHPCVLVPRGDVQALRLKAADQTVNHFGFATADAWKRIKVKADRFLAAPTYSYSVNIPLGNNTFAGIWEYTLSDQTPPRHDDSPAYPPWTAMFQERADSITTRLMHLSFAYMVTGNKDYAERAGKIAGHLAKWDAWTDPSYGRGTLKACLDTGHATYAMGMFYDWCFPSMTPLQRREIREAIATKGIQACLAGVDRYPPDTNGYAVILSGAVIGAVAILPEYPQARESIDTAIAKIKVSLDRGGKDGGAFEGPMYGTYLLDSFAKAFDALEAAGISHDLFAHPYLNTMERYCIGLLAPDTRRMPCFGDGGPTAGFPQLMSILAHRGSGEAAWYLQQIDALDIQTIYDFVRFDPQRLNPVQPEWNPSSVFVDIGYASLRDGFNDKAPTLFFKAGPLHQSIGHNHFDHNSFVLSYANEWLLADRGYHSRYDPHERKFSLGSLGHNTVVLDADQEYMQTTTVPHPGHDQVKRNGAQISEFIAGNHYDLVTGDAAAAYNSDTATVLEQFDRTILFLKPHFFVVHDRLAAPTPRAFAILLQADGMTDMQTDGPNLLIRRVHGEIGGRVAATAPVTLSAGLHPHAKRYGPTLRIESTPVQTLTSTLLLHPRPNANPVFLRNGSFEKGLAGWRPRAGGDLPNHQVVTDNPAHETQCASITNSGYYYSEPFVVPPGKTISAKAMIRTSENIPEDKGAVLRFYFWRNGKAFANVQLDRLAHTNWQEHELTATIPEGTQEVCVTLEFFAPGTAWFDDVRVTADVEPATTVKPLITKVTPAEIDATVDTQRFLVAFNTQTQEDAPTLKTDADVAAVCLTPNGTVTSIFIKNGTRISIGDQLLLHGDQHITGELSLSEQTLSGHLQESPKPHAPLAVNPGFRIALPLQQARINNRDARISEVNGMRQIN